MNNYDLNKPIFFPRGVADPDKQIGYIANTREGFGIDSIDLVSGKRLWRSDVASRPLLVLENRLVAQSLVRDETNTLRITILDTSKQGQLILRSSPVIFPDWVSVLHGTEETFTYKVDFEEDHLLLVWQAHARYQGGAPPPQHVLRQMTKDAQGIARINLQTGQVDMLPADNSKTIHTPEVFQGSTLLPYQKGPLWHSSPWAINNKVAAVIWERETDQQVLYLQIYDPSKNHIEKSIELLKGQAFASSVTPDGHYLFIHQEFPQTSTTIEKQTWWIFFVETGECLAQQRYEPGTQEVTVLEPNIYYLVEGPIQSLSIGESVLPYTLKARELASGKILWEYPLQSRRISKQPSLRP